MGLFRRPKGPIEEWQPRLYAVLIAFVLIVLWLIILLLAIGFAGGILASQLYRRRRQLSGSTQEHRGADG